MTTYTINGQRIYVREDGPRRAQVALHIHGWSSSWFALSPVISYVSRRYRCLAVDLPGYGNSPRLPHTTTIPDYTDLLASLIRHVSEGPVVLVGHSMGGMISITLALRHPELVERMVLLCPTISGRLSTYIDLVISPITRLERFSLGSKIANMVESQVIQVTDRIMRPALFAERSGISETDYMRIRADARRPGQGRVRAECYRAMQENDLRGKLGHIEAPTLVIWGAEDNTVPLRDAGVITDEWPSADLRILSKASHWPHFETPEQTQRYIASFLGLPLSTVQFDQTLGTSVASVSDIAQFLCSSDIGDNMNLTQRTRLAAQFNIRMYTPHQEIVHADDAGNHLFVIKEGCVDVLAPITPDTTRAESHHVATLLPGQVAGELALLDSGQRSATLRAGAEGTTLLSLHRERLLSLAEEDPEIGTRLVWNIAASLARRLRLTLKPKPVMTVDQEP